MQTALILCLDVQYSDAMADIAGVGFVDYAQPHSTVERVERSPSPAAPYEPGQFYKRELPLLLHMIDHIAKTHPVATVIVDGHVWLRAQQPGLGAHLHQALGGRVAVIGVAKSAFHEGIAVPVRRGDSQKPLWITSAGLDVTQAADAILRMHGPHRIPTLLKRADSLARHLIAPGASSIPRGD